MLYIQYCRLQWRIASLRDLKGERMRLSIARMLLAGLVFFGLSLPASSKAQVFQDAPPLISLGVGAYDVFQQDDLAADFRLEYRHNKGLWIFRPWVGAEVTSDGAFYGVVGFHSDFHLGDRVVLSPSFGVGAYYEGAGLDLGSVVEFRSQLEIAYRSNNQSRLGVALSHISNAGIGDRNPGTEIATLYYSMPIGTILPASQ